MDVQRQLVAKTPVFYRLEQMDDGDAKVGYVRLKEFNALARKDLLTGIFSFLKLQRFSVSPYKAEIKGEIFIAMKRLQGMGASFFVLDLRDNLGGLVQEGIEIAKLFLNEGDTVSIHLLH